MPNITELARQELNLSAQIGIPDTSKLPAVSAELALQAEDPEFASVVGLLLYEGESIKKPKRKKSKVHPNLRKIFNYFIP